MLGAGLSSNLREVSEKEKIFGWCSFCRETLWAKGGHSVPLVGSKTAIWQEEKHEIKPDFVDVSRILCRFKAGVIDTNSDAGSRCPSLGPAGATKAG